MFIEVPKLGDLSWKSRRWTCQNTNSFLTSNGPIGPRWNCSLFPLMSLDRFLSSMFEGSFPDPGIGEIVISCNSHLDRSRWSNTQFIRALGWPPCPQPATLTHEHWCAAKKMETKNSQYMCFFCVCVKLPKFPKYKKSIILGSGKSMKILYKSYIFLHELAGYFQKPSKNGWFRRMVSPVPVWGVDLRTVSCWEQPGVGSGNPLELAKDEGKWC